MRKRSRLLDEPDNMLSTDGELTKLLHDLVDRCEKPAQLLEILYWYEETELAEVMRQFLALPAAAQSALHAFLVMTEGSSGSVTVTVGPSGFTLSSPTITEYIRTLTHSASQRMPSGVLH
jgi:hypothetical protein